MHEASLVQGLLKIVTESLDNYNAQNPASPAAKIVEITCEAGLLACFEEHTLRACFEIFAEGTPAEGAKLVVQTCPLECLCQDCGKKFKLKSRHFVCPACGRENLQFKGGNGLILQAINVEGGEENNG